MSAFCVIPYLGQWYTKSMMQMTKYHLWTYLNSLDIGVACWHVQGNTEIYGQCRIENCIYIHIYIYIYIERERERGSVMDLLRLHDQSQTLQQALASWNCDFQQRVT